MAAHQRLARQHRRRIPNPRFFKDRSNLLEELSDREVFERFRFSKLSLITLLGLLNLGTHTLRNSPLPPILQVLTCLRFLATGCLHLIVADTVKVSRSAAGRCIREVSRQLAGLADQYVRFPVGQTADRTREEFRSVAGFPNVVGCIDGTHIRIQKPSHNEADFVNRKGYHSLNVQMCCSAKFRITSVNASWPGSVHDSRILRTSALSQKFENGQYSGLLLGDSGYPCRFFLMTPILNPANREEERYNYSLCRTRVIIEQTFGILKRRFQCLHSELRTSPKQAVNYILACVVLHNFGIDHGEINVDDDFPFPINPDNINHMAAVHGVQDGNNVRRHIVQSFFKH